jgi:hypothetical protein
MAYDEVLANRVRAEIGFHPALDERKMFGGLAFMLAGNMACGIVGDELMVRTGPGCYQEALVRPHARPMEFTGRPMTGMVFVGAEGLDDAALAGWVEMGVSFAASLPAKAPGGSKRRR